jgi:PAS domain S-box-containing protein
MSSAARDPSPSLAAQPPRAQADPLFDGPGEMRALCRAYDWAATPLGPADEWPVSLRTTVATLLGSRNPMFLFWGPELIQIYNDAYRSSLGSAGRDGSRHPRALGMRGRDFWTDIWEVIGPQIEQVLGTGEPTWHEDQYLPIERDGRLDDVWWTYSYGPAFDDDGRINGVLVVCQETTQRVRAEQALRDSEARYRTLFESMDEGFCVIEMVLDDRGRSVDYRFLDANPAFVQHTGLADAVGRTIREMVPDHDAHWFEIYGRVAQTGEPVRLDAGAKALGRWFDLYAFRIGHPEEGKVAVLFKDVTAARAAEADRERLIRELDRERNRLAEVFRQAPTFLAILRGPRHVFELVNDAYYALVGRRAIIGRPLVEALPEVSGQGFVDLLDDVLNTGAPYVGREVPIRVARTPGAEPEQRFADFVYQPIADVDGTRSGIVAHGHDVTEQVLARRAAERLLAETENARAEAESANRVKAQFLTRMSHELRTPLNAIGGYTELLQMAVRGPVTDEQREFLDRIQQSQRHLLGLINEVLNFAKVETGAVHYEIADVPMADALAGAESLVAPQAQAKGLELVSAATASSLVARADPEKLRQVLANLLSNAVKFTDAPGRITMAAAADGDRVRVEVSDTGVGIPADKLDAIFDPFVQVRSDLMRPYEGTGLGLAISRDLARGMGGELTAASTPGAGSTFTLWLPRA